MRPLGGAYGALMATSSKILRLLRAVSCKELAAEEVGVSLEIAAALGSTVRTEEWRLACINSNIAASDALVDEMVDEMMARQLASGDAEEWSFRDPKLRGELEELARRSGRWRQHQSACAEALFRSDRAAGFETLRRRAAHLEAAGKEGQAFECLLQAADAAFRLYDYTVSGACLEEARVLLDRFEERADPTSRARLDARRARLASATGQSKRARELIAGSRQVLAQTERAVERGQAEMVYAKLLRAEGRYAEAREHLREAGAQFAMGGDEHGLAQARAGIGASFLLEGDPESARGPFLRALEGFKELDEPEYIAEIGSFIAHTYLSTDEYERAREHAAQTRDLARRHGFGLQEANAWMVLGEVARVRGELEEARRCYGNAEEYFESVGSLNLYVCRCNIALVELAEGNLEAACSILEAVEEPLVEAGMQGRLAFVFAGLMACACGEEDWARAADYYERAVEFVADGGSQDPDVIRAARLAADFAAGAGRQDLRRKAESLVRS